MASPRIGQPGAAQCTRSWCVRAPGERRKLQESVAARAPQDSPGCLRRDARRIGLHPPAATAIETPERQVDQAFVLRWIPFHNRPIGLCDLALLEQEAELFERLVVPPEHEAARGVAIEPVHKCWVARQAKAERR